MVSVDMILLTEETGRGRHFTLPMRITFLIRTVQMINIDKIKNEIGNMFD